MIEMTSFKQPIHSDKQLATMFLTCFNPDNPLGRHSGGVNSTSASADSGLPTFGGGRSQPLGRHSGAACVVGAVSTPHATCCAVDCLPLVLAPYNHGIPLAGAGRNPVIRNALRVRGCCRFIGFTTTAYPVRVRRQNQGVVALRVDNFNHLDTGLTEGQPVQSLSKARCDDLFGVSLGRNDAVFANGLSGFKAYDIRGKLGVGAAFVRKFMFGGIDDAHEIEQRTGLAVFASVPRSEKQASLYEKIEAKASGMFVLENVDTHDAAIESLRSFRTALQFAMLDAKNNRVMITGSTPGLGKSFVAVNTAAVLAASGKRVLLIDLDMRKGHINQYMGLTRDNGIAELLAGERTFDQIVRRSILPNLDFIPTGVLPSAPHLLLQHGNLKQFLEKVSAEYDLVLMDTPPVLAVTDATMLSEHIGTSILVAREGITTLGELNETVKRFTQVGVKVSGVVFNAVRPRPGKYGYGYGKYRYSGYAYEQYSKGK